MKYTIVHLKGKSVFYNCVDAYAFMQYFKSLGYCPTIKKEIPK